jgi:23S rRNA G2445 N2-methylase RlmL
VEKALSSIPCAAAEPSPSKRPDRPEPRARPSAGNFGFRHLKGFPAAAWKELRKKAQEKSVRHFPGQIIATDMDRRAIAATEQNAANASVQNWIHLAVCDYSETDIPRKEELSS